MRKIGRGEAIVVPVHFVHADLVRAELRFDILRVEIHPRLRHQPLLCSESSINVFVLRLPGRFKVLRVCVVDGVSEHDVDLRRVEVVFRGCEVIVSVTLRGHRLTQIEPLFERDRVVDDKLSLLLQPTCSLEFSS